jgi:nitroimidazol reductase NimA-like FMN-containing flavoprotein (pyridoxamine 5'-phosphate oxidase superfamily)
VTNPIVEQLDIPHEYGTPTERLDWSSVESKLKASSVYWIASTRPDGRPHVVPRDGIWLDGCLYYGGVAATVHHRNITSNPEVVVHIGDGHEATIVEGAIEIEKPTEGKAGLLIEEMFAKYPQYGRLDPDMYSRGVLVLRPRRVIAWTDATLDATRFRFPESTTPTDPAGGDDQ